MQDITPILDDSVKVVESYGDGQFKISGEQFDGSVLIGTSFAKSIDIGSLDQVTIDDLKELENIEILLVGYGDKTSFLPSEIEKYLKQQKISADYMNTGAACRTYNVLVSEERKVAAILIAV